MSPEEMREKIAAHSEHIARVLIIKEVGPGHWIGVCRACPKKADRFNPSDADGKSSFASHNHAEQWWKRHQKTESHKRNSSHEAFERKNTPTEEELLLRKIFNER